MAIIKPAPRLAELLKKRNPDEAIAIKEHLRRYKVNGDFSVGIELELENIDGYLNKGVIDTNLWEEHRDGSLRGNSTELVTRFPIKGDNLLAALDNVYEAAGNSMEAMKSLRTSTHIHVNALDMSVEAVCIFMLAACFAEPYLLEISDPYRKYCGYCLPSKSPIANAVASFLHNKKLRVQAESRYYGVNILALEKYGTIEFRHFSTPHTLDDAIKIVNICTDLKKLALELESTPKFLTKQGLPTALASIRGAVSQILQSDNLVPAKELQLEITLQGLKDEKFVSPEGKEIPIKSSYLDNLIQNTRRVTSEEWATTRTVTTDSTETINWGTARVHNGAEVTETFRAPNIEVDSIEPRINNDTVLVAGIRLARNLVQGMRACIDIQRSNITGNVEEAVRTYINNTIHAESELNAFMDLITTGVSTTRNTVGVIALTSFLQSRRNELRAEAMNRIRNEVNPPNF